MTGAAGGDLVRRLLIGVAAFASANCAQAQTIGWQDAAAQLDARLQAAQTDRSKAPRLTNPGDAALLRAVFDLDAIWAARGQPFPTLSARCDPVRSIGRTYNSLGAAPNHGGALTAAEAQVTRANWTAYHDELTLSSAALLLCVAIESQAIGDFMAALPAEQQTPFRRQAAIEGRQHAANMLFAEIGMQSETRSYTSVANRRMLLEALATVAPVIAETLTLAQRAAVRSAIDKQMPGLSAADSATLMSARRAFESTRCTGMCAVTN